MTAEWMQRVHVPQGFPKPNTDTAPTAAFLGMFFVTALCHMFIFFRNKKRGHFFIFNGLCIGFCMARVITCSLRLAWIYNIEDRAIAIAATIFVAAGVLLLFIINLIFAQRILRGLHPHLGWSKVLSKVFLGLYVLIPALLAMLVVATTQAFFTTDKHIASMDIDMQRGGSSYFLFVAFLPIPILIFAWAYPAKAERDHFGKGEFWHKSVVLATACVLLCLGAAFRVSTIFYTWKPEYNTNPPWYNAKWAFYIFNFTVELIVVVAYLAVRIDLLFHIPNGSKGPYSYSKSQAEKDSQEDVETRGLQRESLDRMSNNSEPPRSPIGAPVEEKNDV